MKLKSILLTAAATISIATAAMAQVPSYVPSSGLVGWWPFNGNANDESGNGNNGAVNGAAITVDRFGLSNAAYGFDGISNVIHVDSFFINNSLNNMSYSVWIKRATNIESGRKTIIIQTAPDGLGYSNMISYDGITSTLSYYNYWNPNNYYLSQSNVMPSPNVWYNVVTARDGVSMKIYINGVLQNTSDFPHSIESAKDLVVGGQWNFTNNSTSENFNGVIDDIGIWNRALTQQEITDLYNGNICYQTITVTDTLLINMGVTGFNPVTYNNTIKIFPNPTNDHITIDYGNFASLNGYQLKIENSLGQQVFQTGITQQSDYLNLTTWGGNGIYFVHIIDTQGNTIDIRKIVLQ